MDSEREQAIGAQGATRPTSDRPGRGPRRPSAVSRRGALATVGTAVGALLAGCQGRDSSAEGPERTVPNGSESAVDGPTAATPSSGTDSSPAWRTTELTPVRGGERFTIGGLDAPVAIHSLAVWCSTCRRQSAALTGVDDAVTVVGLGIDPNEDGETLREYVVEQGYDWRFAVAPVSMTTSLVEAFGTAVVSPASAPVVVACGGGSATLLYGEVNGADEIAAVADTC